MRKRQAASRFDSEFECGGHFDDPSWSVWSTDCCSRVARRTFALTSIAVIATVYFELKSVCQFMSELAVAHSLQVPVILWSHPKQHVARPHPHYQEIRCRPTRPSRNVRATARLAKCAQQNKKSTTSPDYSQVSDAFGISRLTASR